MSARVGDGEDARGYAARRPIRRAAAAAPGRREAVVVSVGRYRDRHYCARCGQKFAACRCAPDGPPAAA